MQTHFQKHHKINIKIFVSQVQTAALEQLQQLYLQAKVSDQTEEIDAQVFKKQLDQDVINDALILLIIV